MKPILVWILILAVLAGAYAGWGLHGMVAAVTLVAFLMLLQFNRLVRLMRRAAESPLGHVESAAMLQASLSPGLPMAKVVAKTKSLGRRAEDGSETFTWTDPGGASLTIAFVNGRCASWSLSRPADTPSTEGGGTASSDEAAS